MKPRISSAPPDPSDITVLQHLETYILERDLSASYEQQLRLTCEKFERWADKQKTLGDLDSGLVNRWLAKLAESGDVTSETIKTQRRNLLVVWNDAYAKGLAVEPRFVKTIKVKRTIPTAWTIAEMQALLGAVEKLSGRYRRSYVLRREFWRAFILTAWDTGLRLGDLLKIKPEDIATDGSMIIVQAKTNWPIRCCLSPETLVAVEATFPPYRELVFGRVLCRHEIFDKLRDIVQSVGLKGGTKKIRKSSATHIEAAHPGAAMAFLGHQTPGLAHRFYIDPRLIQQSKPMPPALLLRVEGGAA